MSAGAVETVTVQYCPCGHVAWSLEQEHIQKSKERAANDFLDALILPSKDCEVCKEETDRRNRMYEMLVFTDAFDDF